jgi:glycosyltransferase involved in cell wall biosynthesis
MGPLKIGINALFRGNPSGAANYVINLVNYITALESDNEYYVFIKQEHKDYFDSDRENIHEVFCSVDTENPIIRRWWEQSVFPGLVNDIDLHIIHCPMNVIPNFVRCGRVVTILDCQYFHPTSGNTFLRRLFHKLFMHISLRKANAVITISHSMKEEIFRCFGQSSSNIHVIPLGQDYSNIVYRSITPKEIKKKLGLFNPYLLFVGFPQYRKNLTGLLRGFAGALKNLERPYDLVLCGDMKEGIESDYSNIQNAIEELGIRDRVRFVGYIDNSDLYGLMSSAELFTFPSFYEGFGLPVIEAMACGTTVLVSDIPVMHEVAGDAGFYVNPHDTDDICKGIRKLLTDDNLRNVLAIKGKDRAARFTWENTAEKTLKCYQQVTRDLLS